MHNVKTFLEDGKFIPPDVAAREAGGGRGPELLHISHRSNRAGGRAVRYVVVEGTEKFKPDYWERVVCVFTTGHIPVSLLLSFTPAVFVSWMGSECRPSMAVSRVLVFPATDPLPTCLRRLRRIQHRSTESSSKRMEHHNNQGRAKLATHG